MARALLWLAGLLLFICAAVTAINFVGFGPGFPLIFVFVAAVLAGVLYPLRQRRIKDEAVDPEGADPSIPPTELPDYRRPWRRW